MNDDATHTVDSLVRSWLEGCEPAPERLAALRARILEAARRERAAEDAPSRTPCARPRRREPLWAVGGVAAVVICAVAASFWLRPRPPGGAQTDQTPPQACFNVDEVILKTRLFTRMNEVFSGRLAWIAETDGRVELGLDGNTAGAEPSRAIAVRLVVVDRPVGDAVWQGNWSIDLVLESEQSFAFKPPWQSGRELSVWTHVLPDGMVAIDSVLRLSSSSPEMIYSGVETSGVAAPVFRWQAEGREYEVFQTVFLLRPEFGWQ